MASSTEKIHENNQALSYSLYLFAVIVAPFVVFPAIWDYENLPKMIWIEFWAGSLGLLFLLRQARNGKFSIEWHPLMAPGLIFFSWITLSFFWTDERYEAFTQWLHWSACLVFFFIGTQILDSPQRRRYLLAGAGLVGVIMAVFGMAQFIFEIDWIRQQIVPAITFNNKNMATQYIVMTLPALLYLVLIQKTRWMTWCLSPGLAVILVFPLYTTTRASQLALLAILSLLVLWFGLRYLKTRQIPALFSHKVAVLVVAGLMALTLSNLTPDGWHWRGKEILQRYSIIKSIPGGQAPAEETASEQNPPRKRVIGSARLRIRWYQNTIRLIAANPVTGVGMRNFYYHYPEACKGPNRDDSLNLFKQPQYAHSDHLQLGAELGLPVYLIVLWFIWLLFRELMTRWKTKTENSRESDTVFIVSLAAIAGLTVNTAFSFPLYRAIPPFYGAVYLALLTSVSLSVRIRNIIPGNRIKGSRGRGILPLSDSMTTAKATEELSGDSNRTNRTNGVSNKESKTDLPEPDAPVPGFAKRFPNASTLLWGLFGLAAVLFVLFLYGQIRALQADYYFRFENRAIRSGDMNTVTEWGEFAHKANPWRVDIAQFLANGYQYQGKHEKAAPLLQSIVDRCPWQLSARYYHALSLFNQNQLNQSEENLKEIIKILPDDAMSNNLMGHIRIKQNLSAEAWPFFRKAVENKSQNPIFWKDYAQISQQLGKWSDAALGYSNWTRLDPKSAEAHYRLGIIYATELKRPGAAKRHLTRGLQLDPRHALAVSARKLLQEL